MASKPKSTLSDTPGTKATPTTPRIAKLSKTSSKFSTDSPSPLQSRRASIEHSPRTVTSKSSIIARPSPRVATPPDKGQSRILKPSELQAQLTAAQEELKKAKEKLLLVEKEKAEALVELEEARKLANNANEKLQESVVAQKQAEESSEVENFWAAELDQVGIDAVSKKEEEWQQELQQVRNQHAMDMTSLLTTSEELQRVKQELAIVTDTKNQALIHAEEATKIAEIHAEKVEFLSAELGRVKGLCDSTIKTETNESATTMELSLELDCLKQELEIAKGFKKNLAEKEESFELLKLELTSVKEELERAKGFEKIVAQKEESRLQLELEYESIKRELEKAKDLEENLCQKEESFKHLNSELKSLKQEMEKAKSLEEQLSLKEEFNEQLKSEVDSLKHELEKANGFEENLIQKDESLHQLKLELESIKQELEKAKGFEEELSQREESYKQLKSELDSLKHELEKTKGFEEDLVQKEDSLQQLKLELESLKHEHQKAIGFEEKLSQIEESYEQLNIELEASRMAESYSCNLLDEWKNKVEALELQVKVDLEESEQNLEKTREEASAAAKEIILLKSELQSVKEINLQALENEKRAASSSQELLEEKKKLVNEIESMREEEEKINKAMESLASALHEISVEAREAKEKLLSSQSECEELENQKEDLKSMLKVTNEKYESLLDDAKCEINHLTSTMEHSKLEFEQQIEDMRLTVKETNEKNEALLSDAKCEIDQLKDTIEHLKADHENAKFEWEQKEVQLVNCIKTAEDEKLALSAEIEQSKMEYETSKSDWQQKELELVSSVRRFEEAKLARKTTDDNYGTMLDDAKDEIKHLSNMVEKSKVQYENSKLEWEKKELQLMKRSEEGKASMEKEIMRLVSLLREKEEHACSEKEAMSEVTCLKEALDKAKAEEMTLKNDLQERESRLQTLTEQNEQIRALSDANIKKVEELSKLLEEATARKHTTENGEFSDSEKDYDMLPKVVEFSEENGHVHKEKQMAHPEEVASDTADLEPKMWESCKIDDFSMEKEGEHASVDGEVDTKAEVGDGFDQLNAVQSESNRTSPSKDQQQKKKRPLYRKFGNLLKKGIGNQK